jgi:hypothetical protein
MSEICAIMAGMSATKAPEAVPYRIAKTIKGASPVAGSQSASVKMAVTKAMKTLALKRPSLSAMKVGRMRPIMLEVISSVQRNAWWMTIPSDIEDWNDVDGKRRTHSVLDSLELDVVDWQKQSQVVDE